MPQLTVTRRLTPIATDVPDAMGGIAAVESRTTASPTMALHSAGETLSGRDGSLGGGLVVGAAAQRADAAPGGGDEIGDLEGGAGGELGANGGGHVAEV